MRDASGLRPTRPCNQTNPRSGGILCETFTLPRIRSRRARCVHCSRVTRATEIPYVGSDLCRAGDRPMQHTAVAAVSSFSEIYLQPDHARIPSPRITFRVDKNAEQAASFAMPTFFCTGCLTSFFTSDSLMNLELVLPLGKF